MVHLLANCEVRFEVINYSFETEFYVCFKSIVVNICSRKKSNPIIKLPVFKYHTSMLLVVTMHTLSNQFTSPQSYVA